MLKDTIKKYYIEQNYNCSEAIILGCNEYYSLNLHENDMKLVGEFGGGLQNGNTCGCILSCIGVLSLMFIEKKAHESSDIALVSCAMQDKFFQKYKSYLCKDVKPISFVDGIRCLRTIETSCDILEEIINEMNQTKIMYL